MRDSVDFIFIFLVKSYGDVVGMATMFTALASATMQSFVARIERTMYFQLLTNQSLLDSKKHT